MIISHIKRNDLREDEWDIQSDVSHNAGVAALAEQFAEAFGFGSWGRVLGLLHDKGKEQQIFQRHIKEASGYEPRFNTSTKSNVKHAYVGALIAKELFPTNPPILSYCILGHHAGLPNFFDLENTMMQTVPKDVSIEKLEDKLTIPKGFKIERQDYHHFIRLLYSCLVDADYLDTEAFMSEKNSRIRKTAVSMERLSEQLDDHLIRLKREAKNTAVNKIRQEVQLECLAAAGKAPGFYSLTVPTGGGKTLSSLVWAIRHAVKHQKQRIIIAIPYTSIIVQTAEVLRSIFGEENVLEHHSNTDPEKITNDELTDKLKLASENWDYPIVITTNVQLFESMFSNKPSACRKLHNICNSVLILDEVQTLPLEYLQPIVDGLSTYQRIFGTSVLFTTASQPALKGTIQFGNTRTSQLKGIPEIKEIIPDGFNLHNRLKRVNLLIDKDRSDYDAIAERIAQHNRVLCIVNTRSDAKEIFERLPQTDLTLHLSRMMCPNHISETIEKIKTALKSDDATSIRVVSTQLIEAGVDIDFPVVFRQEAGLDSLLQAAGRCNREGKQPVCNAFVFKLNRPLPKGYISNASNAQKSLPTDSDWFDPKTMIDYFIQLYSRTPTFDKSDVETELNSLPDFCFANAAESFKLISDNSQSVIVNYKDAPELIERLKAEGPHYKLMKLLNQYRVNLREPDFKELKNLGLLEEIITDVYFLTDRAQYDQKTGLVVENHWLDELLTV